VNGLDRPFWAALNGRQAGLARWNLGRSACRIDPDYGPFAGGEDLASLLRGPEDEVWVVEREAVRAPGLVAVQVAPLVQMVFRGAVQRADDAGIVPLDDSHSAQMAALALATKPGPWGAKTQLYGQFYGIFDGNRLISMAGERARPAPGWAEVSGVCTDPAYRGRGLARGLIARVVAGLAERGDSAYLHSWAGNAAAIALYEQLGFEIRCEMVASVLRLG
jgi:GNAT superfamily N-acetyltransferase